MGAGAQFSYRATKDGQILISWEGRIVTRLAGQAGERFLTRVRGASEERVQEELRRATGNFKHGNER